MASPRLLVTVFTHNQLLKKAAWYSGITFAYGPQGPGFESSNRLDMLRAPWGGARSLEGHAPGTSKGVNLRTNGSGGDRPPSDVSQVGPETVTHTD